MELHTENVKQLIGDFTQSTLDKTEHKSDDAYTHLFEPDNLDDELIEPQEVDNLGNPIIRPEIDEALNDAPFMKMMMLLQV